MKESEAYELLKRGAVKLEEASKESLAASMAYCEAWASVCKQRSEVAESIGKDRMWEIIRRIVEES